jgi:hypothetical protein
MYESHARGRFRTSDRLWREAVAPLYPRAFLLSSVVLRQNSVRTSFVESSITFRAERYSIQRLSDLRNGVSRSVPN